MVRFVQTELKTARQVLDGLLPQQAARAGQVALASGCAGELFTTLVDKQGCAHEAQSPSAGAGCLCLCILHLANEAGSSSVTGRPRRMQHAQLVPSWHGPEDSEAATPRQQLGQFKRCEEGKAALYPSRAVGGTHGKPSMRALAPIAVQSDSWHVCISRPASLATRGMQEPGQLWRSPPPAVGQ